MIVGGVRKKVAEQPEKMSPRERARTQVNAFVKRLEFDGYVKQGLPPEEAARRIGVKLPPGKPLSIMEILRIIQRGTTQRI